jgi:transcriptional regulator with XRE-family HTH domain
VNQGYSQGMGELHATLVSVQGDRLAQVIQELRWSQRDLAQASGVSQPTISRMIAGLHRASSDAFQGVCAAIAKEGRVSPGEVASYLVGLNPRLVLSPIMDHR